MKDKFKFLKVLAARLSLSLMILMIFAASILAQTGASVFGIVSDLQTPVAGATVVLTAGSNRVLTAQTDANGKYVFENVPSGNYLITAELPTGAKISKELKIGKNQSLTADLTFGIQTPVNVIKFGEVTVIASGTAQPVAEVSKSISVVSNRELNDRNEIEVIDALRTVPGLRVQQTGGFGRLATIKIRGLRNQDTAVLIDGQRFRDATAINGDASPFLSDLQLTNVERIEVLRGSGSSLYGTNAIGGVFSIQTDNFTDGFRGTLLAEGGGLGEFRGRANFGGDLGDRAFYNFGVAHTNFGKGVDGDDAARNTSGKVGFQFRLNDKTVLTSRFYVSDAFVQLNSNPDTIGTLPATGIVDARPLSRAELRRFERGTPRGQLNAGDATFIPDQNDPDASQASRFYNFNLAFDGIINSRAAYQLSYQNLQTRRRNLNGTAGTNFQPFGGASRSDFDGNIQTARAKTDVTVRSNLLTAGYEFEREKFGNDNFSRTFTAPTDAVDDVQTSHTIFAQDQIKAFDGRLQLSGGFRAQLFRLDAPRFGSSLAPYLNVPLDNPPTAYTFDGSAAYFFRAVGTKLRAHVGNGYRAPSLYERFGSLYATYLTPNRFVPYGDPNLKPERTTAFDAGVEQNLANNRVRLSATYFYTRLYQTIGFLSFAQADRFGRFSGYANTKGGLARGIETSAEIKPFATTDVFASYTFTNSDQRQAQVAGSGVLQTLGIPKHQFTAVVTQRIVNRLTLNFDFLAASSYLAPIFSNTTFATRVYRFEGNRRGDLTASYEIPVRGDKLRARLFGTIENIFNQDYYENGFRTARAQGRGGLQLNF